MGVEVNGQSSALAIDLQSSAEVDCVVTNTGSATEAITLVNILAGLEWSDDSGANWNTGNDSFSLAGIPTDYIGYWDFDGDANDDTGNYNGFVSGATLTTNRNYKANSAYNFDGINDIIYFTNLAITSVNKFSFAAWVNLTSAMTANNAIFRRGRNTTDALGMMVNNGNKLDVIIGSHNGGTFINYNSSTALSYGVWHHVAFTYDGDTGNLKVYIDGALDNSVTLTTLTNFIVPYTGHIYDSIGANYNQGTSYWSEFFNGKIDEVYMYTNILTLTEIERMADLGVITSKTYKLRHDSKKISTTSVATTISLAGTNTVTVTPTVDSVEALDLLTSSDYILIENTTSSPVSINISKVGGVEYSTDGGSSYNSAAAETGVSIPANSSITRYYRHDSDSSEISIPPTLTYDGTYDVELSVDIKPSFAFPSIIFGSSSSTISVVIDNTGDSTLNIGVTAPTNFKIKPTGGSTWYSSLGTAISVGSTYDLDYGFVPLSTGTKSGDSVIDYGVPTLDVGLSGTALSSSIATPIVVDFGRVENNAQSSAKTVVLTNGYASDADAIVMTPEGFLVRESGVGSYTSSLEVTVSASSTLDLDVVAYPVRLGTIRENMLAQLNGQETIVYLIAESVMSEYMTIKVEDDGIEVGRLEKNVIILHREKLINTETDREIVNETPTTETRIITPPTGTNALLIYSKWSDPDEYWRLRVADISTTALANQSSNTSYFSLASTTMSEGSRMWYKDDSIPTDFDFFDRDIPPYFDVSPLYGYRTIDVADDEYLKITTALDTTDETFYPFTVTSLDTPHLLAYIPIVFGDRILVQVDKTDKEFEIICLKEV